MTFTVQKNIFFSKTSDFTYCYCTGNSVALTDAEEKTGISIANKLDSLMLNIFPHSFNMQTDPSVVETNGMPVHYVNNNNYIRYLDCIFVVENSRDVGISEFQYIKDTVKVR